MARVLGMVLVGALTAVAVDRVEESVAAPKGRVVRVERGRGAPAIPRICDVRADRGGTCLGTEPQLGELVTVLDESSVIATVRITEATPFPTSGNAPCTSLWNVKTEVVHGDLSAIPMPSRTIGVVDVELHPRKSRLIPRDQFPPSPSGRPEDQVMVAVDRDGDRTADLILAQSTCDVSANPGIPIGSCIDEYSRVGGRMVRVQQTNFALCGF